MKSSTSFIAVALLAVCCTTACKKNKDDTPPTLYIFSGGGTNQTTENPTVNKIQITENASYYVSYSGDRIYTSKKLSDAIHDSLRPYLASFPRAAIKADPNVHTYSKLGVDEDVFQAFVYVRKNPTDSTAIYLDVHREGPDYIQAFWQQINRTMANNHVYD